MPGDHPAETKCRNGRGRGSLGGGGGAVPRRRGDGTPPWWRRVSWGAELWAGQAPRPRTGLGGGPAPVYGPGRSLRRPRLCVLTVAPPSFLLAAGCQETTLPRQSAETGGGGGHSGATEGRYLVAGAMVHLHGGAESPGGGAMGGSSSAAAHWPLGRPRPRAWPGAFPTQAPPLRPRSGSTFLSPHPSPAITTLPQGSCNWVSLSVASNHSGNRSLLLKS